MYDQLYCARGEAENRIKEQQLDLFADRTSCHAWWPNQFRLLLSSLTYTLLEALRRLGLDGTELANAYVGTIRLKLLKIGAVITRNTRRIRFLLSSAYPYQDLFALVTANATNVTLGHGPRVVMRAVRRIPPAWAPEKQPHSIGSDAFLAYRDTNSTRFTTCITAGDGATANNTRFSPNCHCFVQHCS